MDENDKQSQNGEYISRAQAERDKLIAQTFAELGIDPETGEEIAAAASPTANATVISKSKYAISNKPRIAPEIDLAHIHDGHRIRLRESALKDPTLASFSDVELIELVLSYMIPRKDTNVLAHLLLQRYGTVLGVLTADPGELAQFPNMTRAAVDLIKTLPLIGQLHPSREVRILRGDMLINHIASIGVKRGETLAVFLDKDFRLLSDERLQGKTIPIREIVSSVCRLTARYVFIGRRLSVHDRPADEEDVKNLIDILSELDAELIDYIQVSKAGYGSREYDKYINPDLNVWQYLPRQSIAPAPELLFKLWEIDNPENDE